MNSILRHNRFQLSGKFVIVEVSNACYNTVVNYYSSVNYVLIFKCCFILRPQMGKDYYKILGISKDASDEEIKKAYRQLALKYHPDRNKTADAEETFKEISQAYRILIDKKQRDVYDHLGEEGLNPDIYIMATMGIIVGIATVGILAYLFPSSSSKDKEKSGKKRKETK